MSAKEPRGREAAHDFAWQKESAEFRQQHGAALDWKPWTGRPEFRGRGLPKLPRVLDVLDCLVIHVLEQKKTNAATCNLQDLMQGMYVDVSQGFLRHFHTSTQGVNHALTTSSIVYSYDRDSVLTGRELLQLHGQPVSLNLPSELTESQISHLAGEGMALPCLAGLLWCLYLCKQFPA